MVSTTFQFEKRAGSLKLIQQIYTVYGMTTVDETGLHTEIEYGCINRKMDRLFVLTRSQ